MPAKKPALIRFLLRKAVVLALVTLVFGWLYGWAAPWAYSGKPPAGFGYGLLHGAMMPLSLPSLVIGKEVPIYAVENSGRWYKIGYICVHRPVVLASPPLRGGHIHQFRKISMTFNSPPAQ